DLLLQCVERLVVGHSSFPKPTLETAGRPTSGFPCSSRSRNHNRAVQRSTGIRILISSAGLLRSVDFGLLASWDHGGFFPIAHPNGSMEEYRQ
ncbi:hypothetical protein, partial [Mesorhizobium sp. M7A.F.Ca.CA.001.10.2.1]|uniref:hypothetical protein n=1 Tax=Mesorhizobium sp. M7A.F.Ca.CA.001.10.2.1 TaxID=2496720 RepID=UPI0019D18977